MMCDTPPPANHFNYDELEHPGRACTCRLCGHYRSTLDTYDHFKRMCKGHSRSCTCYLCTQKNEAQIAYLASVSKRDTYSELSYLVGERPLGPRFLDWLYGMMEDSKFKSDAWWAIRAPCATLQSWIDQWQGMLPPRLVAVSGLY